VLTKLIVNSLLRAKKYVIDNPKIDCELTINLIGLCGILKDKIKALK